MTISKSARICVLGAGPAGLATAFHLQESGYTNVVVLEKLGRVGGLCISDTFKGASFDLGANYVTSSYTRVRKLARRFDAEMYIEEAAICRDPVTGAYRSLLKESRGENGLFTFGWAALRYIWERWKLRDILPTTGFVGVSNSPELMVPFTEWLKSKDLLALKTLFQIPIHLMGYGKLDEIPAPYALRYMAIGSYLDLLIYGLGIPSPIRRWPRRFTMGFQRFFEKIAWNLDVRVNTEVIKIERGDEIRIRVRYQEQHMQKMVGREEELTFDKLILCCPLTLDVLDKFLDVGTTERKLFKPIKVNPFSITTFSIPKLDLPWRIINMMPDQSMGKPYIVTQQFEDNPLVTFYTRVENEVETTREEVIKNVEELIADLEGTPEYPLNSYDCWPYFPHYDLEQFSAGYYDQIASIQGENNTFYNGGLLCFELIEPIIEFSESLVERHFLGQND